MQSFLYSEPFKDDSYLTVVLSERVSCSFLSSSPCHCLSNHQPLTDNYIPPLEERRGGVARRNTSVAFTRYPLETRTSVLANCWPCFNLVSLKLIVSRLRLSFHQSSILNNCFIFKFKDNLNLSIIESVGNVCIIWNVFSDN